MVPRPFALLLALLSVGLSCFGDGQSPCPAEVPIDCGAVIPDSCCPRAQPICCARDQNCYATAAECAATCQGEMATCRTSADCCMGLACGRIATFCRVARNLDLGDPCTASAQCLPGLQCESYCTRPCNSSAQCGAHTCMVTTRGFRCAPACDDSTDCAGTGLSCRSSTDPGGMAVKGCF